MGSMFFNASSLDADIGHWDVFGVEKMGNMFRGASSFNQDISNWRVNKVELMNGMFRDAASFNQNLGKWDIRNVTDMTLMLNGSGMDEANYDATLLGWGNNVNTTGVQSNVTLGADGLESVSYTHLTLPTTPYV